MSRYRRRARNVYEVRTADRAPGDPSERVIAVRDSFEAACAEAKRAGGVTWVQSRIT